MVDIERSFGEFLNHVRSNQFDTVIFELAQNFERESSEISFSEKLNRGSLAVASTETENQSQVRTRREALRQCPEIVDIPR
jgi:hypothetical protein